MIIPILIFFSLSFFILMVSFVLSKKKTSALKKRLDVSVQHEVDTSRSRHGKDEKSIFASIDSSIHNLSFSTFLKKELNRANWSLKVSEFIVIVILSGSFIPLLVLLFTNNKTYTIFLIILGALFPFIYLKRRQASRSKLFAEQLLDAITLISNSLKSGYSFLQSIDLVARELAPPISEEFRKVLQEIKLGMPFEQAVKSLVDRVGNEDLDLVMTSVNIQREVGGNLSEVLDKIGHTIRERIRIKGHIKSLTAQGRMSGMILGLLPCAIMAFLFLVNPQYVSLLFKYTVGQILIGIAVIMQLIGMFFIKKIVDIKV